jgi:superfamily II DNA helicase RecQ
VDCGVSSNELTHVYHKGLSFNVYDVVQEMGRANRTQKLDNCSYTIYLSFPCLLSTYARIMANPNSQERRRLEHDLCEVVAFLIVPQMCYHSFIETYFEWETKSEAAVPHQVLLLHRGLC